MYKNKRDRGDRGSSPVSKRSRSSTTLGRYNTAEYESDDDVPVSSSRKPSSRSSRDYYDNNNSRPSYKDSHGGGGSGSSSRGGGYEYKVLCISSLHSKASDDFVRESLYREFKRWADISVKIVHEADERVAYVYFRCYEDAREAKHSHAKSRISIYDKTVMIEAAYESTSTTSTPQSSSSLPPPSSSGSHMSYNERYNRRDGGGHGGGGGYERHHSRDDHPHPPHMPHRGGGGGGGGYNNNDRYGMHSNGPPPPHHHGGPPHPGGGPNGPYGSSMRHHEDFRRGGGGDFHPPPPQRPMYPQRYNDKYGGGGGGGGEYYNARYAPLPHGPPRGLPHGPLPPHPPLPDSRPLPPGTGGPYEPKKDKFPNYLHHIAPEDDPLATRTLFAGNLEVTIGDEEMRRIFGRYGTVEDIDIKRPPPGTGNAYAFVRFANLDMAARAKTELSGQYIGKFQCKIGYGKVNPTTKIWVGGLGSWATLSQLEREFDRFGSIKKIDWLGDEEQAFITYETIDAAQEAVKAMRGYPLGGTDKRIRTDFAGVEQVVGYAAKLGADGSAANGSSSAPNPPSSNNGKNDNGGGGDGSSPRSSSPSPSDSGEGTSSTNSVLKGVKSVGEIAKKESSLWTGSLILKNSSFPTKFYLTEGDFESIKMLLKDEDGKEKLRITQRLRLDQSKLDDVMKRMSSSSGHGIFLAWPTSSTSPTSSPSLSSASPVQSRPLKNLMSYLKQKEAAGVISLVAKGEDLTGVLYAFPPCPFSTELLARSCPGLGETKEEYLVVLVIRGGTA